MLLLILYALGLRAFLFEIKFPRVREKLESKHKLFEIFLNCPFCNGFWCGVVIYLIFFGISGITIEIVFFSLTVGFISYLQNKLTSFFE